MESLNSCEVSSSWAVSIGKEGNQLRFDRLVSSQDCASLTSNWTVGNFSGCSASAVAVSETPTVTPGTAAEASTSSTSNETINYAETSESNSESASTDVSCNNGKNGKNNCGKGQLKKH